MLYQIYDCQCTTLQEKNNHVGNLDNLLDYWLPTALSMDLSDGNKLLLQKLDNKSVFLKKNFPKVKVIKYYNHLSYKSMSRLCYNVRLQGIKLFWTTNQRNCCATILWKCHPVVFSLFHECGIYKTE